MHCQMCGTASPSSGPGCAACREMENGAGGGEGRLRTDGGAPADETGGAPEQGGSGSVLDRVRAQTEDVPLAAGGFIGAVALVVPYLLVTAVTYVAANRGNPIDVAAGMFFTLVEFGPGRRIVSGFVSVTDVSSLRNVRPADYPSVEGELGAAIDLLQASPEAGLLLLYMIFPWTVYLGGRYLSRHYAASESLLDHVRASATVVVGTLPTVLLLGLAFSPGTLLETALRIGVLVPGLIAATGALSVYAFRDVTASISKLAGWLGVGLGMLVTFVLFPPLPFSLDVGQKFVFAAAGYLSTASFRLGFGGRGLLIFLGVALTGIVAGFVRTYVAAEALRTRLDGAHLGASVALGTVGAVAVLGALVPLLTIVVRTPVGAGGAFATVLPSFATYLQYVFLAGGLFALAFGALGGYLAARYLEDEPRPAA